MEIKKSASKAFLVSASILLLSMLFATVYALITGEYEGKDLFAAPLLGFYIAFSSFIIAYPITLVFFIIRSSTNRGANDKL